MQKLPAEGKSQKLSPHPAPPKWPRQGPTATLATLMAPPSTTPPSLNKASSPLSMPSRPETYKAIGSLTPEPLEPCAPTAIGSTHSKRSKISPTYFAWERVIVPSACFLVTCIPRIHV